MKILLKKDIGEIREIILNHGYKKKRNGPGYTKKVRAGRLHMILNNFENQTLIVLHYDKFKHKKNKKFGHSTRYVHPYIKSEFKELFGVGA